MAQPQEDGQQLELEEEDDDDHDEDDDVSLSLCSDSVAVAVAVDVDNNMSSNSNSKAARLPRWTRQEILVLIQGKRVAENRVRRGRMSSSSSSVEPKWATVSSYCKRHGVNRGAVQCRKRWSNLAGDFKKIKEWESQVKDDSDSFWLMRNDLRRDRKLPGFFDREVFDILDDKKQPPPPPLLLFDSGRTAPADDALFSELPQSQPGEHEHDHDHHRVIPISIPIPAPTPISVSSAKQHYQPFSPNATPTPTPTGVGVGDGDEKLEEGRSNEAEMGWRKRKRVMVEEAEEERGGRLQEELIEVMEKNGRIISTQLEAHNMNLKLDRQDRKEHTNSIVAVLNKLADALAIIADKL